MRCLVWVLLWGASCGIAACGKEPGGTPGGIEPWTFVDGFETADTSLASLFPSDGSRWTNLQRVDSETGPNRAWLSTDSFYEGAAALSLVARQSGVTLSKMDIEKGGFFAPKGATIRAEASFFIQGDDTLQNLLLMDLECCSCWDPAVPDNQCPGIRLQFSGGNDWLVVERGKILGTSLRQHSTRFPRNRWVPVVWELGLSPEADGANRLWIDGTLVIDEAGFNMPHAQAFADTFALYGIDFELAEPLGYERFQIGATANASDADVRLLVDDVRLYVAFGD